MSPSMSSASQSRYSVIGGGLVATGIGVVACVLIAVTASGGPYWSTSLQLVMYLVAAIALAGLLGLIFGVPRARTEQTEQTDERYATNSNLEQISDWLTKILVGAGLVQLAALPGALAAMGRYLGDGLEIGNGPAVAVAVVLYGMGIGFLFFYLWARLRLRVLLESTEKQAEEQSRREQQVAASLTSAAAKSDTAESAEAISRAAARASAVAMDPRTLPNLLWVDDHPENNADIVAALRALGVPVELALSTDEALQKLGSHQYGLIITDLGREENGTDNPNAGLDLITAVRNQGNQLPIFVYGGSRAMAKRDELVNAGATFVTNRPTEIFNKAIDVLTGRA